VGSDLHLSVERGSGDSEGRDDFIDSAPMRIVEGDRIDEDEDEGLDLEGDNLRRCRLSEPLIFAEADSNDSRQRFFKLVPFLASSWYGYGWRMDTASGGFMEPEEEDEVVEEEEETDLVELRERAEGEEGAGVGVGVFVVAVTG
jgi:hypothetical protein